MVACGVTREALPREHETNGNDAKSTRKDAIDASKSIETENLLGSAKVATNPFVLLILQKWNPSCVIGLSVLYMIFRFPLSCYTK